HFRSLLARHGQPFRYLIKGNHALRSQHPGTGDRELTHGATAPDGNRVARLNSAVLRGHVTGGKNIREKQNLVVVQVVRNFQRPDVSVGHPHILRLTSRITAYQMGISKYSGGGVPPELLRKS